MGGYRNYALWGLQRKNVYSLQRHQKPLEDFDLMLEMKWFNMSLR